MHYETIVICAVGSSARYTLGPKSVHSHKLQSSEQQPYIKQYISLAKCPELQRRSICSRIIHDDTRKFAQYADTTGNHHLTNSLEMVS